MVVGLEEFSMLSCKLQKVLGKLSSSEKDELYKLFCSEHIAKDIVFYANSQHIPITSLQAVKLADLLVYSSKYDCDKSYWKNIESALSNIGVRSEYV